MADPKPKVTTKPKGGALGTLTANLGKNQGGATGPSAPSNTVSSSYTTVFTADQAQTTINKVFQDVLKRVPTPKEVADLTPKLIAAQKKNPGRTVVTTNVDGSGTAQTSIQGLDETAWLTKQITSTTKYKAEYANIQKTLGNTALQEIQGIAANNGVTLTNDELMNWGKRLIAGESPEVAKAAIRSQAALGQPESVRNLLNQGVDLQSIFSPYRNAMAATLEINPTTISLSDPVLRSAIKPEGEVSIYDFQRELRKDPRWQYTNNAREEVSSSVQKVLKDFGFMG